MCYNITLMKSIHRFPSQKPWMTSEVKKLLKDQNTAFSSGHKDQYGVARAKLKKGIKEAIKAHKIKIKDHLTHNDTWRLWHGLQQT